MRKTIFINFVWLLLINTGIRAQEPFGKDSLLTALKTAKEDTEKVKLLISTGQQYEGSQPDSAIWYYEQALHLSKKLGYTRGIISYFTNATYVYNILGKYDTSLVLNLQALEISKAFGDPERIIACTNNVAASYYYLEDFVQSADYYLQTLDLLKKHRDEKKLCILYSNLANIYNDTEQFDKTIFYADSAIYLARKFDNAYTLLLCLNTKSLALIKTYQYSEAQKILHEGIALSKKVNDKYTLGSLLENLADLFLKTGKTDAVEPIYREALHIAESVNDKKGISISYRGLGYYYLNKKEFSQAWHFTQLSLRTAHENNYMSEIQKDYLLLSDLALATGKTEEYNILRMKSDSVGIRIVNDKITKNIQNLEEQYKAEQKEREIEFLNHESEVQKLEIRKKQLLLLSLLGVMFTAILSFFFIWRSNRQKQRITEQEKEIQKSRIAELEIEKQLVTSEAILKGQEEERTRLARDLHDGLGGMLSGIKFSFSHMKENLVMAPEDQHNFERSLEMLGSSIHELRRIAHNMMPESLLKFGLDAALKDFCTDFNNNGAIKVTYQSFGMEKMAATQTTLITVYRIVQELLNNIRKHAAASEAMVQLIFGDNTLSVAVEDNGKGFNAGELEQVDGIGWRNIKSRVEYLKGHWDIQSEPDKGTAINIEITITGISGTMKTEQTNS